MRVFQEYLACGRALEMAQSCASFRLLKLGLVERTGVGVLDMVGQNVSLQRPAKASQVWLLRRLRAEENGCHSRRLGRRLLPFYLSSK